MLTVNEFYKKGCQEKTPPAAGGEIFSRDPAHCNFASLEKFDLPFWGVSSGELAVPSSLRERQASVVECVNHGSIRGSWPMAISGYPRGHNVKWVTRCPRHTGPDLID